MELSRISAGTMNWGAWGKWLSQHDMSALINTCVSNKITTFDHADIYGGYTTEAEFGAAFALSGVARESLQFITKCGIQYPSEKRPLKMKYYDYSRRHITESVENSLRNLQTDYIDVLLLHRPSPLMQGEVVAEAVHELKSSGKIRSFGVSNFTPSQVELLRRYTEVSFNQFQFSATTPEPMTDGTLDYMKLYDIVPMAWNPLGVVFREDTEQTRRMKMILEELAAKYGTSSDVILISWILKHPAGIIPVFGTTDANRIKLLARATETDLDLEDWFSIWVGSRGVKVP